MTFKHISSRDNTLFKQLRSLATSARERRLAGKILLDGAHLVEAYFNTFGMPEMLVISDGDCGADVLRLLEQMGDAHVVTMPVSMLTALSPVNTPTGMLALVKTPQLPIPKTPALVLMLENIQDPGNLGSMLRNAAAAGADLVYLSEGCTEAWSPKALRGGQGAQFVLPIIEHADLLDMVKNFNGTSYAAVMHGEPLYKQNLGGNVAFLIGNEGAGLSFAVAEAASRRITIPMPGKIESLNAAAATAICLFERVRQTHY